MQTDDDHSAREQKTIANTLLMIGRRTDINVGAHEDINYCADIIQYYCKTSLLS